MKPFIKNFPKQLEEAIKVANTSHLTPAKQEIRNVLVAGLGGSCIGALLVKQWIANSLKVPMAVHQDYFLPTYVNQHTLLIIASYSGNTEETLQAFEASLTTQAKIVCITSGGKLKKLAEDHGLGLMVLPTGMPPRACLGYAIVQQLFILFFHGLINIGFTEALVDAAQLLHKEQSEMKIKAQRIAKKIQGKMPVIYATIDDAAVALRWQQQFNENSKMLCWHRVFPAMSHNELVGWRGSKKSLAVILLQNESAYYRVQAQMRMAKEIFEPCTKTIIPLSAQGKSLIERSMYMVHLGDWVSYYLAQYQGIDPNKITAIDQLKDSLKQLN